MHLFFHIKAVDHIKQACKIYAQKTSLATEFHGNQIREIKKGRGEQPGENQAAEDELRKEIR